MTVRTELNPVIVTISDFNCIKDLLNNDVIETVARVVFPTLMNLEETIEAIKKSVPEPQIKLYMQSHVVNLVAVARTAMFAIGSETAKLMALEEMRIASDTDTDLTSSATISVENLVCPLQEFYPTIVTISKIRQKQDSLGNRMVEGDLRVVLPTMDNLVATQNLISGSEPDTEIQTHFRCDRKTVQKVGKFVLSAIEAQGAKEIGTRRVSPGKTPETAAEDPPTSINESYFGSGSQRPV